MDVVAAFTEDSAILHKAAARLIEEGERRCSGHILVLDAYTIRRVLAEVLAEEATLDTR